MNSFRFIAEASSGETIKEETVTAPTHKEALRLFWNGMADAERDNCACVECLDVVAA